MWSLGCVILEIANGIPLWMSLKTVVTFKNQEVIKYGLFAVKGRIFEKIIER
jgi:dual specificity tyrosine-phosphorylation-regulated kinase 2/3/4